ncbi:GntP family transporter [Nocardioides bruguierae]|uniref:GntP family transporter n=1 Tax=Nocardioides bruguierae TaxID=2945102 RepID=A0A9X2D7L1_9ACTN|nr:GntP family transporter [Nocardioides bruguierae]MCM0620863.1 GntP family transporter [Nocardioides bruguierae]
MGTTGLLITAIVAVAVLLVAIIRLKLPAFLALLGVSVLTALVVGIPLGDVVTTIVEGMGGTLGNVALLVGLGTMLGKLIEVSGGARSLADTFTSTFGEAKIIAALTAVAFLLAIPVFFDVGFIVLIPIIYGFAVALGADPVKVGLPVGGIMLAIHVTVPPHPGVVGGAAIVDADLGWITIFGLVICIPLAFLSYYVAGVLNKRDIAMLPETARTFASFRESMLASGTGATGTPAAEENESAVAKAARENPAGSGSVMFFILLPIVMIMAGTIGGLMVTEGSTADTVLGFVGAPAVALLVTTFIAYYVLGTRRGVSSADLGSALDAGLAPAAIIILVTGAGGVFGKVLTVSGIGTALADSLSATGMPLLLALFLVAVVLRVSQGSATVAIVTTLGLLTTAVVGGDYTTVQVALLVLATGFGALGFSHVTDSGFWVVTRFLGLSVADGLRTWTVLTSVLGIAGFLLTAVCFGIVSAVGL